MKPHSQSSKVSRITRAKIDSVWKSLLHTFPEKPILMMTIDGPNLCRLNSGQSWEGRIIFGEFDPNGEPS